MAIAAEIKVTELAPVKEFLAVVHANLDELRALGAVYASASEVCAAYDTLRVECEK